MLQPNTEFKPPTEPALRALWIIRNWTSAVGNCQTADAILKRVNSLASEVFSELHK